MTDVHAPEQGAETGAPTRAQRRVRDIDFARPAKLSPAEQNRFEQAHAGFCRMMTLRLTSELRSQVEFDVADSAQLTWSAALRSVPVLSIVGIVRTTAPKGRPAERDPQTAAPAETGILISIEQAFVFRMIERLLGGAHVAATPERSLSEIELVLAHRIFGSLVTMLSSVWEELLGVSLTLVGLEADTEDVELAAPSDPTLMLTIDARDASGPMPTFLLLVPYASVAIATKPLSGRSASREETAPPPREVTQAMETVIGGVDVELRAEVGAVELTIGEVLALGVGDVLRLGPAGVEGVFIGDKLLNRIKPGRSGSRRAIQVIESLDGDA